ncbi:MAG: DNA polymerase III subunit delta [Armatimonadetes bacterium]|nr:DNA polymerase III subunit delta [Armatimonadota bacterium]
MPRLDPHVQLTLIHGDAPFIIEREARAFVNAVLPPEEQTYGLTVVDFETTPVAEAVSALYSGSLMAGTRVLLLENVQALRAGAARAKEPAEGEEPSEADEPEEAAKSGTKPPQKVLTEALASIPPGVFVVLTHVSTRERKGYALSAQLSKLVASNGQSAQHKMPWERELGQWLIQEARERGKRLDPAAASLLVELTGRDHGRLSSELDKVSAYVGKAERISADDVSAVAVRSAEATSFQLVDAIAEGDTAKALAMLPDLVPPHNAASAAILLLGMIARNLRLLWQASYLGRNRAPVDRGRPPESLAELLPTQQNVSEATRSDYVAKKLAGHARNFTDTQAAVSLERVLHADQALKGQTGEHLDPRLVVERLVTELCLLAQRSRP